MRGYLLLLGLSFKQCLNGARGMSKSTTHWGIAADVVP